MGLIFKNLSVKNYKVTTPTFITEKVSATNILLTTGFSLNSTITKFGATSLANTGAGGAGGITFDGTNTALGAYNGSSGWTTECWCYSTGNTGNRSMFQLYQPLLISPFVGQSITLYHTSIVFAYIGQSNGLSSTQVDSGATNIPLNQWNHICYTQVGRNGYLWLNGTLVGSDISGTYLSQQNLPHNQLLFGGNFLGAYIGYLDDIRISSGARYGTGATITVPSAKMTVDGSTLALIG
jgi:hypothetical protein